jgi:DNA-binding NarL/FixJ family response regulator
MRRSSNLLARTLENGAPGAGKTGVLAKGGEARKKGVSVMSSDGGPHEAIQAYIENSEVFRLRHWCAADPRLIGEVIAGDVVLIHSCGGQPKHNDHDGVNPVPGPTRAPVHAQKSSMGRRRASAELTPISRPGMECLLLLKKKRPELPVIMFSKEADLGICMRCFLIGADGYFVVPGTPESFESLVADAIEGWKPFSREIQRLMAERIALYSMTGRAAELTETEAQIVWCFASGLSNKDITNLRNVSPATVHSLTCNILHKLKVHRRADAVRVVLKL